MIRERFRLLMTAIAIGEAWALSAVLAGPDPAGATGQSASPAIPRMLVLENGPRTAPGMLFVTLQNEHDLKAPHGPTIYDQNGRPVWFHPIADNVVATNLRVVRHLGLIWWEGVLDPYDHLGSGRVYVADEHYRVTRVPGTDRADLHDFLVTARGTILIPRTVEKPEDLSSLGGDRNGRIVGMAIDEVDIATGKVGWTWNSLDHVPYTESHNPYTADDIAHHRAYDYFHFNSIDEDPRGNLLISARHTSTVYLVDRTTGDVIWRLGGRHSSFVPGPGAGFAWQHAAAFAGPNLIRLFDNTTNHSEPCRSRVIWLRIDPKRKTSDLVRQITYPRQLCSPSASNAQELDNGDTLVGWGPAERLSEFSPGGDMVFDATFPPGWSTYRAYRHPWTGTPLSPPSAIIHARTLHAVWNGATGVASWRLNAGPAPSKLRPVSVTGWNGLDTAILLPSETAATGYVSVDALNSAGKVVGSSPAIPNRDPAA